MKILHVTTRLLRDGGAERNLRYTVNWQRERGHEVDVVAGLGSLRVLQPTGIPVRVINELVRPVQPVHDLRAAIKLIGLIRAGEYDLVHTHESKAGVLGRLAARATGRAAIHTVHMPSFGPGYSRSASRLFMRTEAACAALTDVIVTVGTELRDFYLASGVGDPEQYLVVRSPVEIERFAATRKWATDRREAALAAYGIDSRSPLIVSVAALEPRKRHRLLIERMGRQLASRRIQLAIAGEGPEMDRLRKCAFELGVSQSVHFLGHVRGVEHLLAAADVFVHASAAEGVSQAVIQALAAGLPVVITDAIGSREVTAPVVAVVDHDGRQLAAAVRNFVSRRPEPLPLARLAPWTSRAVDDGLETLHDRLAASHGSTTKGRTAFICG